MPKSLSLQQCLTVCCHYESLRLHIQQIRPDKHVEYLKKHHQKSKQRPKSNPPHHDRTQSFSRRNHNQTDNKQSNRNTLLGDRCYGCGCDHHKSWKKQCPAWGQVCRKCHRLNHYEAICGMIPPRRR